MLEGACSMKQRFARALVRSTSTCTFRGQVRFAFEKADTPGAMRQAATSALRLERLQGAFEMT